MDVLRSSSNETIQCNEGFALEAIFGDAFKKLEATNNKLVCFELTLVPHPGIAEDNHSAVKMKVTLPELYPIAFPKVNFERLKGLSDPELLELQKQVQTKISEIGGQNREILYELAQFVEEFLQQHNNPPQSLHDQMMARQAALKKEEHERLLQMKIKEREEAEFFEARYQQNRLQSLLGDKSSPSDDVFTAMGREVSRAALYREQRTNQNLAAPSKKTSGRKSASSSTVVAEKKARPEKASIVKSKSKAKSDSESGYSSDSSNSTGSEDSDTQFDDEYEDEEDEEDEDYNFHESDNEFGFSGSVDDIYTQSPVTAKKTGNNNNDNNRNRKTKENTTALKRTGKSRIPATEPTNTFFEAPVGLGWDNDGDADSDEYSQADKTINDRERSTKNQIIPHPKTSYISYVNARELASAINPLTGTGCKIFKAINPSNSQIIVVKEYSLPNMTEAKAEVLESLCEMICQASRQVQHESIAAYLGCDYKSKSNSLLIFREFLSGSLATVIGTRRKLEEPNIRVYLKQMVRAISYLHGKGIYGLNLKVSNLLLDNVGSLKLCDYIGASSIRDLMRPDWKKSNDHWWSPEVRQHVNAERERDLFDLGVTFLEMATGSRHGLTFSSNNTPGSAKLPSNFTSDAVNFLSMCIEKKTNSISDLICHPFVAFDDDYTQGEFVPLSPASSAPGFSPFLPPQMDSFTTESAASSNWSSPTPSAPSQTKLAAALMNLQVVPTNSAQAIPPPPQQPSRYRIDFEELEILGKGGFGQVVKARNKLDRTVYAIKKIRFGRTDAVFMEKLRREVTTLSRLNHPHVVRYFQAWIDDADEEDMKLAQIEEEEEEEEELSRASISDDDEEEDEEDEESEESEEEGLSRTASRAVLDEDIFGSVSGRTFDDTFDEDIYTEPRRAKKNGKDQSPEVQRKPLPSKILYIQMEYCTEKTLKNVIDENKSTDEHKWKLFRQIVEGLNHIHSQGIIHRDLKPTNVFIDASGDIKIGDFGLAVSSGPSSRSESLGPTSRSLSNSRQAGKYVDDGLTTGVGTPLYLAPEQDRAGSSYNQKVDLYSLGIIFFELFTPFSTAMERYRVIMALRGKDIKLPPAWDKDPIKCKLVRWLLSHDPDDRPTTLTLLQSDFLPVKLEEETLKEAMRHITVPNTTLHSLLIKKLFSTPLNPTTDLSYDLENLRNPYEAILRDSICRKMTKIFETHAADFVEPPAFFPRPTMFLHPTAVQLLDTSGTVISVPFDLTMPFARYVAHKNIWQMRRYVFGKVYRLTTGQPREMRECDFDLVGSSKTRLPMACEVVQVLIEVMNEFKDELGRFVVRFNNFKVLDAIVGKISEKHDVQRKIRGVLAQFWRKHSPKEIEKQLLNIEGITSKMLDGAKLEQLLHISKDMTCAAVDMLAKIEALYPRDNVIAETLRETRQFLHYAELFRVASHLRFDITLIYNYEYYYDIIFQGFVLSGDIIAVGGCYDGLVDQFAAQEEPGIWPMVGPSGPFGRTKDRRSTSKSRSAVGMNIALDNLVARVWEHQRQEVKNEGQTTKGERFSVNLHSASQIIVYSHLRHPISATTCLSALEERIQVVQLLWKHGFPSEYFYDDSWSLEQLTRDCESKGISWIVILKETKNTGTTHIERRTPVRIKDVRGHAESAMTVGDLPTFFASKLRPHSSSDMNDMSSPSSLMASSSKTIGARGKSSASKLPELPPLDPSQFKTAEPDSLDVEIIGPLRQEKGAKGKREIVRTCTDKLAPILKSFSPRQIIKVGAIDVPIPQIREILVVLEAGGDISALERKLVKFKDRVPFIKEFWVKIRRDKNPYAFFYSIIDDDYQISFMKK